MKAFSFPPGANFCVCIEDDIFEDFIQLIDEIYLVAKLKNCDVETIEIPNCFNIIVKDKLTGSFSSVLNIMFDNLIFLKEIRIDYEEQNLSHIETLRKFLTIV
jgi:hypothetical protein